jgi:hypothetical protein
VTLPVAAKLMAAETATTIWTPQPKKIITDLNSVNDLRFQQIPLHLIDYMPGVSPIERPAWLRHDFDHTRKYTKEDVERLCNEHIDCIADSLRRAGQLQNIIVRRKPDFSGRYEVLAGTMRVAAARKNGMFSLEGMVYKDYDESIPLNAH